MPPQPATIAKAMLIGFAIVALAVFVAFAIFRWSSEEAPNILATFMLLLWIVGPAALATFFVARAWSRLEAWLFLCAAVATIITTAWLWIALFLHTDGQGGLSVLVFPLWQLVALFLYAIVVVFIGQFVRNRSTPT